MKLLSFLQLICLMLVVEGIVAQGLSGNYTIGPDNADYETLTLAVADLQAQGVGTGGATFTIQPGNYNETVVFENITGVGAGSALTFQAEPGTVTYSGIGTTGSSDAIFRINGLSYLTFHGINLQDASTTVGEEIEYGYYFNGSSSAGCSYNTISYGAIVLGIPGERPKTSTRGIYFKSSGSTLETSNSFNTIDHVSIDNSAWGIQLKCNANFYGVIVQPDLGNAITNCVFGAQQSLGHDFSSSALAINALGGKDMLIHDNIIESVENLNSSPAIPVSTSGISLDACSGEVSGNFINHIEYEGTIGSVFGIKTATLAGDTTLIINNKISGLKRSNYVASTVDPSLNLQGIWIFNQNDNNGLARIFHNSIYLQADELLSYNSGGINLNGGSSGKFPAEVFNNIIVTTIGTTSADYQSFALVDGNTERGYLISDYNLLFANGENGYLGGIGRELGGNQQFSNDLQEFIAFSQTNENSSSFMPDLAEPATGDLSIPADIPNPQLYLVPMLPEVPYDILGIERRADGTFFGAYEGPEVFVETGKIQGFVRDAITNLSIADAQITATNTDNGAVAMATPFGSHYSLLLPAGTYNVTCSAEGYQTSEAVQIIVEVGQNIELTFYLQ
ncbi:MAG: carboxypeptidase regulatory-like domain-containing protein, partial [Clostridia bacterium]|nr:carboxypeptidase regulatory-like domain-containing protein [Clostridia bacterium]